MKSFVFAMLVSLTTVLTHAHEGFELSLGAGQTNPFAAQSFLDQSTDGNASHASIGYFFGHQLAATLGFDAYDFDRSDLKGEMISLGLKYGLNHSTFAHPYLVAAVGTASTKNTSSDKHTGVGAKLGLGLEFDWKYVSVGGVVNLLYNDKAIGVNSAAEKISNAQAIVPMIVVSFHSPFAHESKPAPAPVVAPVAKAEPIAPPVVDTDADGVADTDDKCPSTSAGVKVNSIGCAETEKASVKLQITFSGGKAEIDPKFMPEIEQLGAFMKKFPETKVEIAGHTDSAGSVLRNTKLSQARAEAVAKALAGTGVEVGRITAKGYGPSQPVASNETPEGRGQNRRVVAEISVTTEIKK